MGYGTYERLWKSWLGTAPPPDRLKGLDRWLKPGAWRNPGQTDDLLWGEVRTRGSLYYKVALDRKQKIQGCTCSAKSQPCVHTLALLTAWQDQLFEQDLSMTPPAWVPDRLQSRPVPGPETPAPPSGRGLPDARLQEMAEGYRFLETWLIDQTREGWRRSLHAPATHLEEAAARLVNYRLPGPARVLRELNLPSTPCEDQTRRLLRSVAALFLACRAFRQEGARSSPVWPHLLQFSGQTLRREQVLAVGETVHDHWLALSNLESKDEDGLKRRENWLFGLKHGRPALLLAFAWKRQPLAPGYNPGQVLEGSLHFYPGDGNQRALPGTLLPAPFPAGTPAGGHPTVRDFLDALTRYRTRDPWSPRIPALIAGQPSQESGDHPCWLDAEGAVIPCCLPDSQANFLLSFQGIPHLKVFGLFEGRHLLPLSLLHHQEVIPLLR
jgi:hypothetical protein